MSQQELNFDATSSKQRRVNVPKTSREAHESVKEHKEYIYEKIKVALTEIKIGGTSEEIATHLGMEHEQIWKRLSEMERAGIIFNLPYTRKNTSGRKAMVRQLIILGKSQSNH